MQYFTYMIHVCFKQLAWLIKWMLKLDSRRIFALRTPKWRFIIDYCNIKSLNSSFINLILTIYHVTYSKYPCINLVQWWSIFICEVISILYLTFVWSHGPSSIFLRVGIKGAEEGSQLNENGGGGYLKYLFCVIDWMKERRKQVSRDFHEMSFRFSYAYKYI